jgi:hypothetical protein
LKKIKEKERDKRKETGRIGIVLKDFERSDIEYFNLTWIVQIGTLCIPPLKFFFYLVWAARFYWPKRCNGI